MSKRLTVMLTLMLAALPGLRAQEASPAPPATPSRIAQVTVYPGWAYVNRELTPALAAGLTVLTIGPLPAWIDEDSVRASVGQEGVRIVGAAARPVFVSKRTEAELKEAEQKLMALRDQQAARQSHLQVLLAEREYYGQLMTWRLGTVPQESQPRTIAAEELAEIANLTKARAANDEARQAVELELREGQRLIQEQEKLVNEIRPLVKQEHREIVVELEAAKAVTATVRVGYLVSGASWYPIYDARTDGARTQIAIGGWAVVQQSTGEDWSEARMALSTVNPSVSRNLPQLNPWLVTAQDVIGQQGGSFSSRVGGKSQQKLQAVEQRQLDYNVSSSAGQVAYGLVLDNRRNAMEMVRQAEARGTTAEFEVPNVWTIVSDGRPVRLPLSETTLPATPRYTAVPALTESTYVTGQLRYAGSHPLLPGEVRIYLNGSYIGRTDIDLVAAGEKLDLYLGLEERIKVTRKLDGKRSATAFFSGNKRLTMAYTITVGNYLDAAATIEVHDQMPVSQDERVKIKLLSAKPDAAARDRGLLVWTLPLAAGKSQDVAFEFQIEYPADVVLENLQTLERIIEATQ